MSTFSFPLYSSNCAIVIAYMYGCGINLILETGTHFPNEKIANEIIHLKLFRPYLKKGAKELQVDKDIRMKNIYKRSFPSTFEIKILKIFCFKNGEKSFFTHSTKLKIITWANTNIMSISK